MPPHVDNVTDKTIESDEPEWVIEQSKARKRREMLRRREDMEDRLSKIRAKEKAQRQQYLRGDSAQKRRKPDSTQSIVDNQDEEQFVLDDYDSDSERSTFKTEGTDGLSAATLELMQKLGMTIGAPKEDDDEGEEEIKVIRALILS
jgi:chromosome transmission fidelity protein 1